MRKMTWVSMMTRIQNDENEDGNIIKNNIDGCGANTGDGSSCGAVGPPPVY